MKLYLIALLIALSVFGLYGQAPVASLQTSTESALSPRMEAFEKVWTTVNERHYDPTFGGVDWNKVRGDYLPLATAAKTDDELHAVLRRMLGELRVSHFGIYPKEIATQAIGSAGIGVELKMLEGEPVVWLVDDDSTGWAAGIRPGFAVRRINGRAVADILRPLEAGFAERGMPEKARALYRERALEAAISGAAETLVTIEALNARGRPQVFRAVRKAFGGELSQPVGNFPAQQVIFSSRRLDGDIGYIRFNMWVIPQMPRIRQAIGEFSGARGIVFDLRGNPGGVGGLASGTAGLLVDKQVSLGTMRSRSGSVNFTVYPQEKPFLGPVVILTDYGTGSTSEIFAAGLQETGRAIVIGETSAGAVLPSVFDTLPTGAIFQYAISDYRSPKNILIEGRGVTPDRRVVITKRDLLSGRDPQLEAAVQAILNAAEKSTPLVRRAAGKQRRVV